jgi:hypothetical protein
MHGYGVEVYHTVIAFVLVGKRGKVFDSSEVVAYRKVAAWLNGGKYSLFIF